MQSEGRIGEGQERVRGDSPLSSSSTHCRDDADGHQHTSAAINRLICEQKVVFERLLQQSRADAVDKSAVCARFVQSLQACQTAVCQTAPSCDTATWRSRGTTLSVRHVALCAG